MTGERRELHEQIIITLMSKGIDASLVENALYIILDKYEVCNRCTEVSVLSEDRNEYLLKKFIIAKTVKGCTERTIKAYTKDLQRILSSIGKTVDEITVDDIRYYLAIRQNRDRISKATADNELRYMRTFFGFLAKEELIVKDPTIRIDKIKYNKPKKKAFTELEVEKLRDCLKNNRERAMIEIFLSTGCRLTELVNIKMSEMEEDSVLLHGKGEKDRIAYLNAKTQVAIRNYLSERSDKNPYLFCGGIKGFALGAKYCKINGEWYKDPDIISVDKPIDMGTIEHQIRRIGKRCGVENAHPHRLRRTCATFALRRGMPIEKVSAMLGHESIATTQIYINLTEEELEQAHRKYVV